MTIHIAPTENDQGALRKRHYAEIDTNISVKKCYGPRIAECGTDARYRGSNKPQTDEALLKMSRNVIANALANLRQIRLTTRRNHADFGQVALNLYLFEEEMSRYFISLHIRFIRGVSVSFY